MKRTNSVFSHRQSFYFPYTPDTSNKEPAKQPPSLHTKPTKQPANQANPFSSRFLNETLGNNCYEESNTVSLDPVIVNIVQLNPAKPAPVIKPVKSKTTTLNTAQTYTGSIPIHGYVTCNFDTDEDNLLAEALEEDDADKYVSLDPIIVNNNQLNSKKMTLPKQPAQPKIVTLNTATMYADPVYVPGYIGEKPVSKKALFFSEFSLKF